MQEHREKRAHPRRHYPVPIEVSYLNKRDCVQAQSLNHCESGMCFNSRLSFQPGEALNVRVLEFHPHGPCIGLCEGLRFMTMAEVRWCGEVPGSDAPNFQVGIQFYAPVY